jgi:hypothetical protein
MARNKTLPRPKRKARRAVSRTRTSGAKTVSNQKKTIREQLWAVAAKVWHGLETLILATAIASRAHRAYAAAKEIGPTVLEWTHRLSEHLNHMAAWIAAQQWDFIRHVLDWFSAFPW